MLINISGELHEEEAGDDERELHNQQPQGGNQLR